MMKKEDDEESSDSDDYDRRDIRDKFIAQSKIIKYIEVAHRQWDLFTSGAAKEEKKPEVEGGDPKLERRKTRVSVLNLKRRKTLKKKQLDMNSSQDSLELEDETPMLDLTKIPQGVRIDPKILSEQMRKMSNNQDYYNKAVGNHPMLQPSRFDMQGPLVTRAMRGNAIKPKTNFNHLKERF